MISNYKTQYGTTLTKKFFFHDFLRLVYNFPPFAPDSYRDGIGLGIGTFTLVGVGCQRFSEPNLSPLLYKSNALWKGCLK
jgi:hypothetical protein